MELFAKPVLISVVIWLWSYLIGPETILPVEKKPSPEISSDQADAAPAARTPLPTLPLTDRPQIDRQAFLVSFKRQSAASLVPCLKQWRPSPGSILLVAHLSAQGRLSDIEGLGLQEDLPDCLRMALQHMSFVSITGDVEFKGASIQWRLDW